MKTVKKPWGEEIWWAWTPWYLAKTLRLEAGRRTSLHYHERKHETLFVRSGKIEVELQKDDGTIGRFTVEAGDPHAAIEVEPGRWHRFTAVDGPAELLEASTPDAEDVVRVEDDHGR